MELASAVALLVLLAALSATGFVALFSRARPLYLLGSLVAAGVLAWQAASSFGGVRRCELLQRSRLVQDFDLAGNGEKNIRVDRPPGADGLQAYLISRHGQSTEDLDFASCRWRARDTAGPIAIELDNRRPSLFDLDWNEGFGEGDRTWVELTYRVDDTTRPILGQLQLLSLPCQDELMWSGFALVPFRVMAGFFSLSALGAAAGVVAQLIRRWRTRGQRAAAPIPNP